MSVKKGHAQNTVRLVKRKRVKWREKRGQGGEEEKEETRGQEVDEEEMDKDVERGGEKREGDTPQVSRVTNEERV